jgi:hypothetical protein
MTSAKVIVFIALTLSVVAAAADPAPKSSNISAVYMKALVDDMGKIQTLSETVKTNPRSLCPQYSGNDNSTCVKNHITSMKFGSSTELALLSPILVSVSLRDKENGFSKEVVSLFVTDGVLTLVENVKLADFRLAQFKPKDAVEQYELKMLKADDQKMLAEFQAKIVKVLDEQLQKSENSRDVASAEASHIAKQKELRGRLEKFKKVKWAYSP